MTSPTSSRGLATYERYRETNSNGLGPPRTVKWAKKCYNLTKRYSSFAISTKKLMRTSVKSLPS